MTKRSLLVLFLVLGTVFAVFAATDFSGTWALDKSKSDQMMGGRGGDMDVTLVVKQSGNDLAVSRKMSDRSTEMKYTLDGKENKNPSGRGGESVSKCTWNGANLSIDSTMDMGRGPMTTKEVWALSDGGKVLTISTTRMDRTSKQVFNKQ
jgi:hypothetical protein